MPAPADAPILYRVVKRLLTPVVIPYFRVLVEGLENVPAAGGAIVAANHMSMVDAVVLPLTLDRPVYFLGKSDYWESWKTRWFFQGLGVIPVDRSGGDAGQRALRTGRRILERGDLLGIYPEGTRSPDGRLYRGKTGPVRMALDTGAPIVPCGVVGSDLAMPGGAKVPRRHPVSVRYGRPLDFSRYEGRQADPFVLRSATDELMYEIMMLSGQDYVDEYASKVKSGRVDVNSPIGGPAPEAAGGAVGVGGAAAGRGRGVTPPEAVEAPDDPEAAAS